jgi:hypothetical protein
MGFGGFGMGGTAGFSAARSTPAAAPGPGLGAGGKDLFSSDRAPWALSARVFVCDIEPSSGFAFGRAAAAPRRLSCAGRRLWLR